jgi:hypothetical protein
MSPEYFHSAYYWSSVEELLEDYNDKWKDDIGLPFLYIGITLCGNVAFDPPISETCTTITQPLMGPSEITFRALKSGVVTFAASASGEICDMACYWGVAFDNGPAVVVIADTIWKTFLPVLLR